jgi:hypothetical protein
MDNPVTGATLQNMNNPVTRQSSVLRAQAGSLQEAVRSLPIAHGSLKHDGREYQQISTPTREAKDSYCRSFWK